MSEIKRANPHDIGLDLRVCPTCGGDYWTSIDGAPASCNGCRAAAAGVCEICEAPLTGQGGICLECREDADVADLLDEEAP